MSLISRRRVHTPEMNMTPLIDVSFLLIVFFMLVNRILSEESVRMVVPKLDDPQVVDPGEGDRLVLNVVAFEPPGMDRSAGHPLSIPGRPAGVKVGLTMIPFGPAWRARLDEALRHAVQRYEKQNKQPAAKLEVILRADAALSYDHVQPVLETIAEAGFSRVSLVAYQPGEGPDMSIPGL